MKRPKAYSVSHVSPGNCKVLLKITKNNYRKYYTIFKHSIGRPRRGVILGGFI